jgi:hypothetical protein
MANRNKSERCMTSSELDHLAGWTARPLAERIARQWAAITDFQMSYPTPWKQT